MKKVFVSLLMLTALLLAACDPAINNVSGSDSVSEVVSAEPQESEVSEDTEVSGYPDLDGADSLWRALNGYWNDYAGGDFVCFIESEEGEFVYNYGIWNAGAGREAPVYTGGYTASGSTITMEITYPEYETEDGDHYDEQTVTLCIDISDLDESIIRVMTDDSWREFEYAGATMNEAYDAIVDYRGW